MIIIILTEVHQGKYDRLSGPTDMVMVTQGARDAAVRSGGYNNWWCKGRR